VAQEGDALFEEGAFGRFDFKAHVMEARENSMQPFQEFLLGRGVDYNIIKVAEANAPEVVPQNSVHKATKSGRGI